jgi:hypothetical protein
MRPSLPCLEDLTKIKSVYLILSVRRDDWRRNMVKVCLRVTTSFSMPILNPVPVDLVIQESSHDRAISRFYQQQYNYCYYFYIVSAVLSRVSALMSSRVRRHVTKNHGSSTIQTTNYS